MRKQRGLTIIEILIAIVVLLFGTFVIISTFTMNLRQSTQSRERLMAALVLENLIEEVLAHPYGAPMPSSWQKKEVGFDFVVEGQTEESTFTRNVAQNEDLGNGSFFGTANASKNIDYLTLTVEWTESSGQGNSGLRKELELDLTVRREL